MCSSWVKHRGRRQSHGTVDESRTHGGPRVPQEPGVISVTSAEVRNWDLYRDAGPPGKVEAMAGTDIVRVGVSLDKYDRTCRYRRCRISLTDTPTISHPKVSVLKFSTKEPDSPGSPSQAAEYSDVIIGSVGGGARLKCLCHCPQTSVQCVGQCITLEHCHLGTSGQSGTSVCCLELSEQAGRGRSAQFVNIQPDTRHSGTQGTHGWCIQKATWAATASAKHRSKVTWTRKEGHDLPQLTQSASHKETSLSGQISGRRGLHKAYIVRLSSAA